MECLKNYFSTVVLRYCSVRSFHGNWDRSNRCHFDPFSFVGDNSSSHTAPFPLSHASLCTHCYSFLFQYTPEVWIRFGAALYSISEFDLRQIRLKGVRMMTSLPRLRQWPRGEIGYSERTGTPHRNHNHWWCPWIVTMREVRYGKERVSGCSVEDDGDMSGLMRESRRFHSSGRVRRDGSELVSELHHSNHVFSAGSKQ